MFTRSRRLRTSFPHRSQALGFDDSLDMAGPTSSVEGPAFGAEVVVGVDGLLLSADAAGLVPTPVSELAAGVDALVGGGVHESEVGEPVVLLVAVDVVDLVAGSDGSVRSLPCDDMGQSKPSVEGASEVALGCDVEAIWSGWLRPSLSHVPSLAVSQVQYGVMSGTSGSLSDRELFGTKKKRE